MSKNNLAHDPIATGNAAAITIAFVFVFCRLLVGLLPGLMFSLGQSWFHGIQLTPMTVWDSTLQTFLFGLISSSVVAWLVGYLFAVVYNKFVR